MRNDVNDQFMRGRATQITGGFSNTTELLEKTKLNFKVCEMPVLVQGKTQNKVLLNRKALVRCDNGHIIEIVSDKFKVHQPAEVVAGLSQLAQAGNIQITSGGCLNGGETIFLNGKLDRTFDVSGKQMTLAQVQAAGTDYTTRKDAAKNAGIRADWVDGKGNGDIVSLTFTMRSGFVPGSPTVLSSSALRLACHNGATVAVAGGNVRVTHRQKFTAEDARNVTGFVADAIRAFETYEQKAKRLFGTPFTRQQTQAYVLDLIAPQLLTQAIAVTTPRNVPTHVGLLDQIIGGDSHTQDVVGWLLSGEAARKHEELKVPRTVNQILEQVNTQPGYELARGTAWNAYNAVTYFVDHVRGRSDGDAAIESALSGAGDKLKNRALDLAVVYAERMGA